MENTFAAPTTPGWELFRNALNTFVSDDPSQDAINQVSASLEARKHEHIPDDHRQEICDMVLKAGVFSSDKAKDYQIADSVVHFLHFQVGREKLTEMLAVDGKWEVEECNCNGVGYHVVTTDRQRFRDAMRRERGRGLLGALLGGMGDLVEIDLDELRRRRSGGDSPKPAEEPAPSSN